MSLFDIVQCFTKALLVLREPQRVWQFLLDLSVLKSCQSVLFDVPDGIMKDD